MKNGLSTKNLIISIFVTALLVNFMVKSSSSKIIFIPFLICSVSMVGKSIAQLLNKQKLEMIFGKVYVLGFLLFLLGFLMVAVYTSIREKNYSMLIFSIPFWIVVIFLIKNKLLNRRNKGNGESVFPFNIVISVLLVGITILAGIILMILGIKDSNVGVIFAGAFFAFGAFTFVLTALTIRGSFDNVKIDVLGIYVGVLFVLIGIGFIELKYIEYHSLLETIRSFGLWILIPVMMTVAGVIQIVKCLRK